jgi:hypothetical protein
MNIVTQLDDRHIDSIAEGLGMMTLPAERDAGLSAEAEYFLREYAG